MRKRKVFSWLDEKKSEIRKRKGREKMKKYISEESYKEGKRLAKAGYALAWAAMILMWAVLASQSLGIVG